MTDQLVVFVVEDEILLQEALKDSLEDGGYSVLVVSRGDEAIQNLESHILECVALITDININRSKITGWDIARRAREIKYDIPVIYMTGASAHEWSALGVPNSVLLTKPFAAAQMVTALSGLLNQAAAAAALTPPQG